MQNISNSLLTILNKNQHDRSCYYLPPGRAVALGLVAFDDDRHRVVDDGAHNRVDRTVRLGQRRVQQVGVGILASGRLTQAEAGAS